MVISLKQEYLVIEMSCGTPTEKYSKDACWTHLLTKKVETTNIVTTTLLSLLDSQQYANVSEAYRSEQNSEDGREEVYYSCSALQLSGLARGTAGNNSAKVL